MSSDQAKQHRIDLTPSTGIKRWLNWIAPALANGIWKALWFWEIRGIENFPKEGPVLLIANHPSYLDPPSLVGLVNYKFKRHLSIMAHQGLFRVPIVAFFCRTYKAFPVNRKKPGRAPYQMLSNALKDGGAVGVFPEGSRSTGKLMGDWKPGALRAAFAQKATILPVSNITSGGIWPRTKRFPRIFKKLILEIHEPIPYEDYIKDMPEDMRPKEYQEILAARLRERINKPIRKEFGIDDTQEEESTSSS
ncbi:MAG: lysophospholipid acyltransferase family protein [Planctomycetota bacterium]|jgi:1-acyl-sn-glycerol-3-phosphate acyltransferase